MSSNVHSFLLLKSLYRPFEAFERLAAADPSPSAVLFRYSLWLLLLPPAFAYLGADSFGWRLGAEEPLMLPPGSLAAISAGYLLALVFGLLSTAAISRWMAATYGADASMGRHLALVTIVGEPLAAASAVHLFPDVLVNMLVLIPAMIWSMYLLYAGIPVALGATPERGMLMASALVGWLLVAAVSLLGISMALWTLGAGPLLGV